MLPPVGLDESVVFFIKIKNIFNEPVQYSLQHSNKNRDDEKQKISNNDDNYNNNNNNNNNNSNNNNNNTNNSYNNNNSNKNSNNYKKSLNNKNEKEIEADILLWHKYYIQAALHDDHNCNVHLHVHANDANRGDSEKCGSAYQTTDRTLNATYVRDFHDLYTSRFKVWNNDNAIPKFHPNRPNYQNRKKLKSRFLYERKINDNVNQQKNEKNVRNRIENNDRLKDILNDNLIIQGVVAHLCVGEARNFMHSNFHGKNVFIHPFSENLLVRHYFFFFFLDACVCHVRMLT